jgi:nickel/cobalt exporter
MMEYLLLALSSFGLGALHALEPGHGKTVVGAYLIGAKGTFWDALLLGVVVTLTHTGIVIILGIMSVVAVAFFVPDTVQKVLEVVSGLLIVGVGGWMIGVRIRQSHRQHHHGNGHDEHHEHAEHSHDHGGHGHPHMPAVNPGGRPSLGQLIALGVSGGIVPCPAALAVLLAAISLGGFGRGVSLVVIFSIGMAAVLVAIGIMMVHAAKFAGRYLAESKWTRIVPIVSAIIITLIGVGLTVKAVMDIFKA